MSYCNCNCNYKYNYEIIRKFNKKLYSPSNSNALAADSLFSNSTCPYPLNLPESCHFGSLIETTGPQL